MALQTSIANTPDNAGDEAKPDRNVRKIFSHEAILAPLMRMCIPAFQNFSGDGQRVQYGRSDEDAFKAAEDKQFRGKLYKEFQLA